MEVSFIYKIYSTLPTTKVERILIDYFRNVEIQPYDKVCIISTLGTSNIIECYEDDTLYIYNYAVPDELNTSPPTRNRASFKIGNQEFTGHVSDCILPVYSSSNQAGKYDSVWVQTLYDTISTCIAIREKGSNRLWLQHDMLHSDQGLNVFFDYVLTKLFPNFNRIDDPDASTIIRLQDFYRSIVSNLEDVRIDLEREIDRVESQIDRLRDQLEDLESTLGDLYDEMSGLDDIVRFNVDLRYILDSLKKINKISDLQIGSSFILVKLKGLKLAGIPLPEYTVKIGSYMDIKIYLEQVSMLNDHPHVSREGDPCWGKYSDYVHRLLQEMDLASLIGVVINFLQSYSGDEPYVRLFDWIKELIIQFSDVDSDYAGEVVCCWNELIEELDGHLPFKITSDDVIPYDELPENNVYLSEVSIE